MKNHTKISTAISLLVLCISLCAHVVNIKASLDTTFRTEELVDVFGLFTDSEERKKLEGSDFSNTDKLEEVRDFLEDIDIKGFLGSIDFNTATKNEKKNERKSTLNAIKDDMKDKLRKKFQAKDDNNNFRLTTSNINTLVNSITREKFKTEWDALVKASLDTTVRTEELFDVFGLFTDSEERNKLEGSGFANTDKLEKVRDLLEDIDIKGFLGSIDLKTATENEKKNERKSTLNAIKNDMKDKLRKKFQAKDDNNNFRLTTSNINTLVNGITREKFKTEWDALVKAAKTIIPTPIPSPGPGPSPKLGKDNSQKTVFFVLISMLGGTLYLLNQSKIQTKTDASVKI